FRSNTMNRLDVVPWSIAPIYLVMPPCLPVRADAAEVTGCGARRKPSDGGGSCMGRFLYRVPQPLIHGARRLMGITVERPEPGTVTHGFDIQGKAADGGSGPIGAKIGGR